MIRPVNMFIGFGRTIIKYSQNSLITAKKQSSITLTLARDHKLHI